MTTQFRCLALALIVVFRAAAESNTTNILDGVTANTASPFTLGDSGPFNFLLITNGGRLTNTAGTIGNSSLAFSNLAVVTGTGSVWVNEGSFIVGDLGRANSLIVENAAILRADSTFIGNDSADNRAVIRNASVFNAGPLWIGTSSNASGNLLSLTGPGTVWTSASRITLGRDGSDNQIAITDGAVLRLGSPGTTGFTVGNSAMSRGNRLVVSGLGSGLLGNWGLILGFTGSDNSLVVSDGALVQSDYADIGQNCFARDNVAFVTGGGTVWSNGLLQVGFCSTNNHLVVSNGAQVFAGLVRSSVQGGTSNTITVTGSGSLLRAAGDLVVGNVGSFGAIHVLDGARVEGRNDTIGWSGVATIARVVGPASAWSNVNTTIGLGTLGSAGYGSSNQLVVAEGGRLETGELRVGVTDHALSNVVQISGLGSILNIQSNLDVGLWGRSNLLFIADGASVTARDVSIGLGQIGSSTLLQSGRGNQIVVNGTNSTLGLSGNLTVGRKGPGNRLQILGGGRVESGTGVVGADADGGSNSVLVANPGSAWSNHRSLIVGSNGAWSELTIADGARINSGSGSIGVGGLTVLRGTPFGYVLGRNQVHVTGPGSIWQVDGQLSLGEGSVSNSLVIQTGGVVVAAKVTVGLVPGEGVAVCCPGAIRYNTNVNELLVAGGSLIVSNASHTGTLEARFGVVVMQSGFIAADRITNSQGSFVLVQGGTLRVREGRLSNSSGLNGSFAVGDGESSATLILDGGVLEVAPRFELSRFSTLSGNGEVRAQFKSIDGTISPGGRQPGRLALTGGLTSTDGGGPESLSIDIAGLRAGDDYDQLLLDNAIFSGRIDLRLRNGFVPRPEDRFEIIRCDRCDFTEGAWNVTTNGRVFTVGRLGTFKVAFSPTNLVLMDYRSADLDGDSIEDDWALKHFGHTPLTSSEKSADGDGDGASNEEEFRAGTDPHDSASVFRVAIPYVALPQTLEFRGVPGKEFRVWYSSDLVTWNEVNNPTFNHFSPDVFEWTDDGSETGGLGRAARFYRVTLE